jgi:hypothetical protein
MTLSPIVIAHPLRVMTNRPGYEEVPTHVFDRIARHRIDIVRVLANDNPPGPIFESMVQN